MLFVVQWLISKLVGTNKCMNFVLQKTDKVDEYET